MLLVDLGGKIRLYSSSEQKEQALARPDYVPCYPLAHQIRKARKAATLFQLEAETDNLQRRF
jgi:hypothetical protein